MKTFIKYIAILNVSVAALFADSKVVEIIQGSSLHRVDNLPSISFEFKREVMEYQDEGEGGDAFVVSQIDVAKLIYDLDDMLFKRSIQRYETSDNYEASAPVRFERESWDGKKWMHLVQLIDDKTGFGIDDFGWPEHPGKAQVRSKPPVSVDPVLFLWVEEISGLSHMRYVMDQIEKESEVVVGEEEDSWLITYDSGYSQLSINKESGNVEKHRVYSKDESGIKFLYLETEAKYILDGETLFLPDQIETTYFDRKGKIRFRVSHDIDLNSFKKLDEFSSSFYRMSLPVGCSVNDQIVGEKYYVSSASDNGDIDQSIKNVLDTMLNAILE